jgi:hypothetical protein
MTTRERVRPTRAKHQTMCRTCGQIVGVTMTPWNSTGHEVPAKTVPHKWLGGRGFGLERCPGSLLSVHPHTVMEVA